MRKLKGTSKLFLLSSLLSLFFVLVACQSLVYAGGINGTVNITDWDDTAGARFGLSGEDAQIAGGLVLTTIMFCMIFFPAIIFSKGKNAIEILAIAGILPMLIGVAFGWVDGWVTLLVVLLCSIFLASKVGGALGK